MLGGRYFPSSYGLLSINSTVFISGKLETSFMLSCVRLISVGAIVSGAGVKISLSCALPSFKVGLKNSQNI